MVSKLICALFGHAPLTNVLGRTGYADVCGAAFDGIGRGHLYLTANCPRCSATYSICNVHAYAEPPLAKPEVRPAPSVPEKIKRVESGFKGMFLREAQAYKQGWNECRAAMLEATPEAKP